ncbi:MAG: hypothetical protein KAR83_03710 [Thermodesulfovibrionales bacterium]|nr:hypothetical protein [Thermodesulfovibrionales bacterium]
MGTYGNGVQGSQSMHELLISLDDALRRQRATLVHDRTAAEVILLLQKICEACSTTDINHVCDLTGQVSTYLHEATMLNIPICEEILAHLYVTRALIHEAYESYLNGRMVKTATRTSALIGSFHRCLRDLSRDNEISHHPYTSIYNRSFI